ncbi:armadillo-type protein [Cyathus striatus]|nr:armadillo-type protein [Cyathus striatus]
MEDIYEQPEKRFRHQSYNQQLKEVHLPSAFSQTQYDQDIGDNDSHFHDALDQWRQLNLAPSFIRFAHKVDPLSATMPLLLHNWREIIELWIVEMEASDDEGLRALLNLLQKMAHDLRTTLSPVYNDLLTRLLKLLPRSISAPALTGLLETFSALFRYLLVPSIHLNLLEDTWKQIHETLPKCLPEIQRAMAEVWGAMLRRMKSAAREKAVTLLASNAEGIEDASAWVLVSACKSVSQTLHTATISIITPLVSYHLTTEQPEATATIIRRTLTALIHHVKTADQFSALGDALIKQYLKALEGVEPASAEKMEEFRRMVEVIAVPCAVRQGSRLTEPQITTLYTTLPSLPIQSSLHLSLLKFTTALYTASEMSHWLGPGLKFLQRCWAESQQDISFVLKLHGCLADLGWGGWRLIAMPQVLKATVKPEVLEKEPKKTLAFLASLKRSKRIELKDVDVVWRTRLEKCAIERLRDWRKEERDEAATELNDILTLSTFFSPEISGVLVNLIDRTLDDLVVLDEQDSLANPGWILGVCMQFLSRRDHSEWSKLVDLAEWTRKATAKWATSHDVLAGLVALGKASPATVRPLSFREIYPSLQAAIVSHSRSVRLNALRLLNSKLVSMNNAPDEVLKRCLQGEEVSLDIQGVRERVLRIGRVGQVVGDESGADLCSRWLMAQLKVSLRPLWSPAAVALASLSSRFGDIVWRLLFADLQAIEHGLPADHVFPWARAEQDAPDDSVDDPWEEERSWRDPSAHKMRSVVLHWEDADSPKRELLKAQQSGDRFDIQSYEFQILATLEECPSLAEKHNRDLVPHFLKFAGPDAVSKLPKRKLQAWLTLFSKFSNPKALYLTDVLRTLYISLLSHPDRPLQKVSLACLFSYKSTRLSAHEDMIMTLMDDVKWHDELTNLDIDAFNPQDRQELVDVLIRLLFGIMLERKGRVRGADRRSAILSTLSGCTNEELGLLVDLMLQPLGANHLTYLDGSFSMGSLDTNATDKQLVGFLTLLGDVLKNIGSRLTLYWPALLGTTINLLNSIQVRIDNSMQDDKDDSEEVIGDEAEVEGIDETSSSPTKIIRSIRQLGLKRFADFFRCPVVFDYTSFIGPAYSSLITPRLPVLDRENTQAPSALLELFYVWSVEPRHTQFLVTHDPTTLPKIYSCLTATNVKPTVILRIFDIIESSLRTPPPTLVERTKGTASLTTPVGYRQIGILSEIAQYSTDSQQATTLIGLFGPLLRKPSRLVSEKVKVDMIKIIGKLLPLVDDLKDQTSAIYQKTYGLLSLLFQSLRSRPARLNLVATFYELAAIDTTLQDLARLLESLNAYSKKNMDEPDFDRRLTAFAEINEKLYASLPVAHWLPILYNTLCFIQDPAELAVRNNASFSMRHFIDLVAGRTSPDYEATFVRVLYLGLKNGLHSKNEMVRSEILGVIAYAVLKCEHLSGLQEMRVLLEGGDEEANFFNNILHVQIHRRSRALRRLADHCDDGHLRSITLAEIFVPLVANYIVSSPSADHHLVNEAIVTMGRMSKHLAWGAYFALVQKYLKLARAKDESERIYIRTLVSILSNFHFPMEDVVSEPEVKKDEEVFVEADAEDEGVEAPVNVQPHPAVQPTARIVDAVNGRLLPDLLSHLEKHDQTTDDHTRLPLSIGIVTVAKHLPAAKREAQITRLLTILSQIFRSHSQETRDLTRDALNRIAVNLGPSYLPLIIKELKQALTRGPQLHILAYVVHSLLVHITSNENAENFGILDNCVNEVAFISTEVIFGESGKDVQSEGFTTKIREVKASSSGGFDSFQIMAKFITPSKISSLLSPLRAIMNQTEGMKTMQQVEEVLKRITIGLNSNKHLVPTELIVLCHTLISQNARFLQQAPVKKKGPGKNDAIVQTKRLVTVDSDHYSNNSYRFVAFGLDLFYTALRRNRFDFHDADVMARLETMVVVLGNTLYSTNATVLTLAMKCAASLIKCPLKSLDKSLPVIVRQILDTIKQVGNTESELAQTGLKSLATILRDGPPVQVKEKDLVFLLELLAPDLEEAERQASVFAMLRAIVARKFIVPEIYDMMEKVSEVMVTSQSPQVQDLCRGVLLQFLLDYPQGKGRLRNQMTFFAKNLSYVYESGRKSVMELLSAVIVKFQENLIREYSDLLFVAFVMVVANDDSAKCREMASALIKSLYTRLDEEQRKNILSHLHVWASQPAQPRLTWVSSQVYGFIVDIAQTTSKDYIDQITEDLNASLQRSATSFMSFDGDDEASMEVDPEWQVSYYALTSLSKILKIFPELSDKISWDLVSPHLLFPHAWVRMASSRLLGQLLNSVPVSLPDPSLPPTHPLSKVGMNEVAKSLCEQLKSEHLDEALGLQIVKNLFWIGKCFCMVKVQNDDQEEEVDEEAEVDEEEVQDVEAKDDKKADNPLPWLFSKLSYQVRSSQIQRRSKASFNKNWSQQPLAVLRWFAAMTSHMEASRLEQFLIHILTPAYRLTEDDTIRDTQIDELKTTAQELITLVQEKVGTTKFSNAYNQIRQRTLSIRKERKVARVVQTTTNPELAAKRRMQRNVNKKESRKRKDRGFVEGRGKLKRRREE